VRRHDAGATLVEAVVALGLVALAGAVVASAATAGLRAARRAATLAPLTAVAARELASLAARAADATSGESTLAVPGFAAPVALAAEVERDAGLATLRVHVDGGRPAERVTLVTRAAVGE
jgi:hypothetical protein